MRDVVATSLWVVAFNRIIIAVVEVFSVGSAATSNSAFALETEITG